MNLLRGFHVVVVGGGAIGSFLVALLGRMSHVARIMLVDPETYSESNLACQNISRADVGELKVAVQARRLRAAHPRIDVAALPAAIEDVPLGMLRGDLIVGCVDSNLARQTINEIAWRWQIPWVDSGVLASERLARVSVYMPGAELPCLECAWDARDYALLEAEYPCGASVDKQPSDSSAELASLAASLQAIECRKLLGDVPEDAAISRQVTVDARTHRMFTTVFRRSPSCRFDHAAWNPVPVRYSLQRTPVRELLAALGRIGVAGHRFSGVLLCPRCGFRLDGLRLDRPKPRCQKCKTRMITPDFGSLFDHLDATLAPELLNRSLAQIGFLHGDVISGTDRQLEILPEVV